MVTPANFLSGEVEGVAHHTPRQVVEEDIQSCHNNTANDGEDQQGVHRILRDADGGDKETVDNATDSAIDEVDTKNTANGCQGFIFLRDDTTKENCHVVEQVRVDKRKGAKNKGKNTEGDATASDEVLQLCYDDCQFVHCTKEGNTRCGYDG